VSNLVLAEDFRKSESILSYLKMAKKKSDEYCIWAHDLKIKSTTVVLL
jgi:hypothetical protein